jgi:hypothetical protein
MLPPGTKSLRAWLIEERGTAMSNIYLPIVLFCMFISIMGMAIAIRRQSAKLKTMQPSASASHSLETTPEKVKFLRRILVAVGCSLVLCAALDLLLR